jgi:hypothetical protein
VIFFRVFLSKKSLIKRNIQKIKAAPPRQEAIRAAIRVAFINVLFIKIIAPLTNEK